MSTINVSATGGIPAGSGTIGLASYLSQMFSGLTPTNYYFYDGVFDPTQAFWGSGTSYSSWTINGSPVASGTGTSVTAANLGTVTLTTGNEVWPGLFASAYFQAANPADGGTWEQIWVPILPVQYSDPTPGSITPSDVVAAAYALLAGIPSTISPNGCHSIAQTIAAMAGAPLPINSGSINPNENQSGGYWTVAHRGTTNLVANWSSLLQPGDVVRFDYLDPSRSQHTFTVLSVNGSQVQTIDNWSNSGLITLHTTDFQALADPATVTIYRITETLNTIYGTSGVDALVGSSRDDRILGGDGDDLLAGGGGSDTLVGGLGNDTYVIDGTSDTIVENAGEGSDTIRTSLATFSLAPYAGYSIENLSYSGTANFSGTGSSADNTLTGGIGNDTLDGGLGADTMRGGAGNDTYYVDDASDVIVENANEGTDAVIATAALYTLGANVENLTYTGSAGFTGIGNSGANVITGGASYDNLYGGAGNDTLYGGALEDIVVGDAGDDVLYGGDGGDVLSELYDPVNSGNDTFDGGNGIDIMYSAAGNDTVYGGTDSANNYANLGDGADSYFGSAGTDVVEAGNGNDTITGNAGDDSLYGEAGDDTIYGGDGIDLLSGSTGNDILDGGNGNDLLVGDDGSDTLRGGGSVDVLYGFAGDDILNGGTGCDVDALYGGAGNDSFQVGGAGYGVDYLWDFVGGVGVSDRILVASGVGITSQSTASGNYYINFNNGSQAVIVGRTSVLAEDIVLNGF